MRAFRLNRAPMRSLAERAVFRECATNLGGAMRKQTLRRTIVGNLRDDITMNASRVQAACIYSTVTIWADDVSDIRIDLPERLDDVPQHAVIGTYAFGVALADIEDDLRDARRERVMSWIAE